MIPLFDLFYVFFKFRTSIFNLKTKTPRQPIVLQYNIHLIVVEYTVVSEILYLSHTRYQKITYRKLHIDISKHLIANMYRQKLPSASSFYKSAAAQYYIRNRKLSNVLSYTYTFSSVLQLTQLSTVDSSYSSHTLNKFTLFPKYHVGQILVNALLLKSSLFLSQTAKHPFNSQI